MGSLQEEIKKRKTFGIISHPDAGKTTLTEKLLLFGGAIQTAGAVKSNKIKKTATSDFMEIERQRGISVATSVMAFNYEGTQINLLDTPGHKDFAEDTYRTLTAVDSVILVIDCANGVETQTEKLMEVCRMRNTPVIIFVNKMDREGKEPFDLMDELEQKLNIRVRPLTWPISMGFSFKGVYNIYKKYLNLFSANKTKIEEDVITIKDLSDPQLESLIEERYAKKLKEDIELIEGVYEPFKREEYLKGQVAPVFFGSALNNFGVQELLETFIEIAPLPQPRFTDEKEIQPEMPKLSGFIFKIHANLDPRHRDRIAFLRICSGKFERNKFYHHVRLGKDFKFSNPTSFMAQDKSVIEEAYPGDVVGLYDTGNFKIGDTLTEGEKFMFKGIPNFSPELFKELINTDPLKSKQLEKGIQQLTDEGVAQLFTIQPGNRKIIGTVGELQFEVIKYRLEHEYGASCNFRSMNLYKACWITSDNTLKLNEFCNRKASYIATDKDENKVFLAESPWLLSTAQEDYPDITFHFTSEFKMDIAKQKNA
ncbi:MAG: peptide chain release factor 3 [Bacteroidetes bacterium]|nr:peptide chain release factor 3 [Bacteroidota bacterium]MBV6461543.1 Peptide chain release factor 3 [Flavobacteriales bacterium]WKZ76463.1 MAG: peptide chain release factor 3 [Vicingaceae bacterium]MCL4815711.1 peptide chain release factor 3 [Flavobacteriales bacterium]NOG94148.1 peptide chain release factor 3 [Bacteroidota bacterium]